jgi:FAD/FMN-containing dehydrogenase
MQIVTSTDAGYDEERALFNSMIDKRPAVIAKCATPDDVVDGLELASRQGYDIAVRAGGHSVAGMSTNDGGIVIDVRPMKAIDVDESAMTARVGAGVTWSEFDHATQAHGLATTGGRVSTTGVAGFTLGGGSGWLERKYGLACDNLVSVDLVCADGRKVTASETENAELFWGLRGGGGNFGVATSFTFRLHRVGPQVLAGLLFWPGATGFEVGRAYRDLMSTAPEELGTGLVFLTGPAEEFMPAHLQGTTVAAVAVLWAGEVADGEEAIAPLRALAPEVDLAGPMPYTDFQCMIDDPPGQRNYWTADYHNDFPDDALDVFVKYGFDRPSPLGQQILFPWGGAVARVADDATPMANRSVRWVSHPFAVWEDEADDAANIDWARGFRRDIGSYATGGIYLNFIGDEGQDRVRAAFGDAKYERLARLKAEWDPDNRLRGNQNIRPAS